MRARRWLLIAAGSMAGLFLIVILASVALIESEEVIVIHTRDGSGETHTARVWIVDHQGRQWVAPGNRSNAWFQRLLADPRVEIERDGKRSCHVAAIVESPDSIPALERFLEKYASVIRVTGLLNRLLEPGGNEAPPVAVRLDPMEGGCDSVRPS
ncbi:MAG: hypothetical protein V3T14_03795 [Myxococcota bacterium]